LGNSLERKPEAEREGKRKKLRKTKKSMGRGEEKPGASRAEDLRTLLFGSSNGH